MVTSWKGIRVVKYLYCLKQGFPSGGPTFMWLDTPCLKAKMELYCFKNQTLYITYIQVLFP